MSCPQFEGDSLIHVVGLCHYSINLEPFRHFQFHSPTQVVKGHQACHHPKDADAQYFWSNPGIYIVLKACLRFPYMVFMGWNNWEAVTYCCPGRPFHQTRRPQTDAMTHWYLREKRFRSVKLCLTHSQVCWSYAGRLLHTLTNRSSHSVHYLTCPQWADQYVATKADVSYVLLWLPVHPAAIGK